MKDKRMINKKKITAVACCVIAFVLVLECVLRVVPIYNSLVNFGKSEVGNKAISLTFDDGPGGCI